jgi:hypothetical protein
MSDNLPRHRAEMVTKTNELEALAKLREKLTGEHQPGTGKHRADTGNAA